jgi:hypothetical protein
MRRSLYILSRGFEEGRMDLILVMVFPCKRQNSENSLRLGKHVAHTNKSFWSLSEIAVNSWFADAFWQKSDLPDGF